MPSAMADAMGKKRNVGDGTKLDEKPRVRPRITLLSDGTRRSTTKILSERRSLNRMYTMESRPSVA